MGINKKMMNGLYRMNDSYTVTPEVYMFLCTHNVTSYNSCYPCKYKREYVLLPLDVDSINENDSVANPDPTPRIASVHKSRFAEVVLVGCWMEAVYYCLLLRKW